MTTTRPYDLALFAALNDEFAQEPIVKKPRNHNEEELREQAKRRADSLDNRFGLRGKRVLEIGCGAGHLCRLLNEHLDCEVVGVDIETYPQWDTFTADGVDLRVHDITLGDNAELGTFDRIYSYAVWEHMMRPLEGIDALPELLRDDGQAYIAANLYRGQTASHRYREVSFPWPHLLFDDEVFEQFYVSKGLRPKRPAWVNKLTAAQYRERVALNGLSITKEWGTIRKADPDFLERFADKLDRYPLEDLELDFLHLIVEPGEASNPVLRARIAKLEAELSQMQNAAFWRLSGPMRRFLDTKPGLRDQVKGLADRLRP